MCSTPTPNPLTLYRVCTLRLEHQQSLDQIFLALPRSCSDCSVPCLTVSLPHQALGFKCTLTDAENLIMEFDVDGSGTIDWEEFQFLMKSKLGEKISKFGDQVRIGHQAALAYDLNFMKKSMERWMQGQTLPSAFLLPSFCLSCFLAFLLSWRAWEACLAALDVPPSRECGS